jgi:hypothetical protein
MLVADLVVQVVMAPVQVQVVAVALELLVAVYVSGILVLVLSPTLELVLAVLLEGLHLVQRAVLQEPVKLDAQTYKRGFLCMAIHLSA